MGLFGGTKETKEEKKERKAQELLEKYGLGNLSHEYVDSVKNISTELAGTGMIEFGSQLSGMKSEDTLKVSYLRAIVEQNFIIIRELDEISKKLDK